MFGEIIKKHWFSRPSSHRLIPSHKESPNFWHVTSKLRTTLYWNHIVPEGSAAHEIPNHLISPTLTLTLIWKLPLTKIFLKIVRIFLKKPKSHFVRIFVHPHYLMVLFIQNWPLTNYKRGHQQTTYQYWMWLDRNWVFPEPYILEYQIKIEPLFLLRNTEHHQNRWF